MSSDRYDKDQVDQALTTLAAQGEDNRQHVAVVRTAFRALEDDPVMGILSSSLHRQAQAMEQMTNAIREELTALRQHDSKRFMTMSVIMLVVVVIMGGMVGVTFTATQGDTSIHAEPALNSQEQEDQG